MQIAVWRPSMLSTRRRVVDVEVIADFHDGTHSHPAAIRLASHPLPMKVGLPGERTKRLRSVSPEDLPASRLPSWEAKLALHVSSRNRKQEGTP